MVFDPNKLNCRDASHAWKHGVGAHIVDSQSSKSGFDKVHLIEKMKVDDVEPATEMRLQSWLDTYINDEFGVTEEWIQQRNRAMMSEEKVISRRERFLRYMANGTMNGWVARDASGAIIGCTTPFIDKDGAQHVGTLYVSKDWHGTGVATELMQKVIDWFDTEKPIELGVAVYNERAKAFYKKLGFIEVPGSETLFDGKIPEIKMIRQGGTNEI